jgi:GMP synthase (glutamine-hydrolysing)
MNWKRDSLARSEFVLPIAAAVEALEAYEVKHFLDIDPAELGKYRHIILSGTTLKDFAAQNHLGCFSWIQTACQPLLGICAGMQIISLTYGVHLQRCLGVGMAQITTTKSNPLFSGVFQAYTLHSLTVTPSETFEVIAESNSCIQAIRHRQKPIYGVLFHPEVRNPEILRRFLNC